MSDLDEVERDWEKCLAAGLADLDRVAFTALNAVARSLVVLQSVLSLHDIDLDPGGVEAGDIEHELTVAARALRNVRRVVNNRRLLLEADQCG